MGDMADWITENGELAALEESFDYYTIFEYFLTMKTESLVKQTEIFIRDIEENKYMYNYTERVREICNNFKEDKDITRGEKIKLALFCATI